jgi:hypothetical protein
MMTTPPMGCCVFIFKKNGASAPFLLPQFILDQSASDLYGRLHNPDYGQLFQPQIQTILLTILPSLPRRNDLGHNQTRKDDLGSHQVRYVLSW